jgi:hypothetical protein
MTLMPPAIQATLAGDRPAPVLFMDFAHLWISLNEVAAQAYEKLRLFLRRGWPRSH